MTTRKHAFYGILALVSLLGPGITQSARANFIATINEVGTNVVVTGSGSFDLSGLFAEGTVSTVSGIIPSSVALSIGSPISESVDLYAGFISGSPSFGSGVGQVPSDSGGGNKVGLGLNGIDFYFWVPSGYVSGNPLSDTSTYNNATFATLGLDPGTYEWSWGANQNFTLIIGGAVPDGGSTVSLLGLASLGLVALRRKLRC